MQCGGCNAVAERAEHRVGQRAFVPGPRVTAAVDEERWRDSHAAAPRALDVPAHPRPRRRECRLVCGVARRQVEALRDPREVSWRERRSALHQRLVNLPKLSRRLVGILRQFGGAGRVLAAGDWEVPEHVPHPIAEPAPQPRNDIVDRVAAGARVTAVLDQGHHRLGRPQNVVAAHVDRRVKHLQPRIRHHRKSISSPVSANAKPASLRCCARSKTQRATASRALNGSFR